MKPLQVLSLVITFIFITGIASCSMGDKGKPSQRVEKLYSLMKDKNYEKVAAMYVGKDGQKLSPEELTKMQGLLAMGAAEFDKKEGLDKIEIKEEKISEDGNSADVSFTVIYKNGDKEDNNVSLVKVDGDWYFKIIS